MVTLTTKYQKLCDELKSQTRAFNTAWWRVGEILREIKDGKLYVEEGITWDTFCERLSGFRKRHVDGLIKDSATYALLSDVFRDLGTIVPTMSADAVRAVSDMEPKKAAKLIEKVSKRGPVTAPKIKQARGRVISTEPNLPMHPASIPAEVTESEAREQARHLPDKANVCPHCHGTGRIE